MHKFKSVQVCNMAAMVRTALRTCGAFATMKRLFDEALNDDSALVSSLAFREVATFDTPAFVNTMQAAIDAAFLPDISHVPWNIALQSARNVVAGVGFQKTLVEYLGQAMLIFDADAFL